MREVTRGRITGHLPYSRISTPRGYLVADGSVELLLIAEPKTREMTRECYEFTAVCVHAMLDRVREFKGDDKQQEKMASLGRLSAGLAHELNNPTAAVARAARELDASREALVASSAALGSAALSGPGLAVFEELEGKARRIPDTARSAVAQAALEDRLMEWLESRGIDGQAAYPFAETALSEADLAQASGVLDSEQLDVVIRHVATNSTMRQLTADITAAAERIHSLVAAVKKHTHMDRPAISEHIELGGHLADTITLMRAKAATKDVSLRLTVEPDLPAVVGTVAELNQAWIQLLDNALDAAPRSGTVSIEARREGDGVLVQVVDDGPGIDAGHHERVLEPFFTTKDVGQGRGLGLDIVRSVVLNHRGSVVVDSRPGRTEFSVTLPAVDS